MTTTDFKHKIISLSDRLFPMVARILGNEHKAADAMQEIMIKLWDKRNKLAKHPNVNGFVFLTARNFCLDVIKKNSIQIHDTEVVPQIATSHYTSRDLEWKQLKTIVDSILLQLPQQQREVMTLRDLDGLEFEEISEITSLKIPHLRVILSRARKAVASELKTKYDYEN